MDLDLLAQANGLLKADRTGNTWSGSEHLTRHPSFDSVHGAVHYVGCGRDCTPFFLFENAARFIYQDLGDFPLAAAMRTMEHTGAFIVGKTKELSPWQRETDFAYKGRKKTVLEIHGQHPEWDIRLTGGDIALTKPDETTEALYFQGMPYAESVQVMQLQALPLLKVGGLCIGPLTASKGELIGLDPDDCGLAPVIEKSMWQKRRHYKTRDLEARTGSVVRDYIANWFYSSWPRVDRDTIFREEFAAARRDAGLPETKPAGTRSYEKF